MTTDESTTRFTPGGAYAFHAEGGALLWDYVRAIFSLAFVAGILGVAPPWGAGWWFLMVLLIISAGYLANTLYRHGLRLEMDDRGLTAGWRNPMDPAGLILAQKRRLFWDRLQTFSLRHFSRGKFNKSGWTMVRLVGVSEEGAPLTITFDGDHEGFTPVLHAAWEAAKRRGLPVDEATLANLETLGLSTAEETPWTS